ncbi:MAG TPA: FAD-dependent oxidoreductase, partial [Hydrogenophaga sp.]|nr:FAD-dependent oxidoreductase [Hydrogenophaga sp.]
MIRLSELKLPLTELPAEHRRAADAPTETDLDRIPAPHPLEALTRLSAQKLGIPTVAIKALQVFKRSFDARKADLLAVYIVDVSLVDPSAEEALLLQHQNDAHILATPDMAWHAPVRAPVNWPAEESDRPVVVGLGPCGLFAAL